MSEELPRYRLKQPSFFEPELLPAGSIVTFTGVPGDHLEPLNAAAEARMEEWYDSEVEEIDPRTRAKTGKYIKVRAGRKRVIVPQEQADFTQVEARPTADTGEVIQSLGEIMAARKPTNQRPPPASVPKLAMPEPKAKSEGGKSDG